MKKAEQAELTPQERRDLIDTLVLFTRKAETYYERMTDQQLLERYDFLSRGE